MSLSLDNKDDTSADEEDEISLFEVVVSMRRLLICGRRSEIWDVRSEILVEADTGMERVEGRFSPGKEVKKTFIVLGAIMRIKQRGPSEQ